jgi:hypothetical protein
MRILIFDIDCSATEWDCKTWKDVLKVIDKEYEEDEVFQIIVLEE